MRDVWICRVFGVHLTVQLATNEALNSCHAYFAYPALNAL